MAFLSRHDYNAIRAAIDLSIDEKVLPDATIELPMFLGAAEQSILSRDPLASSRVGISRQHIKNAIILLTAAYIAPSIPYYVRESFGDYSYTRMEQNMTALTNDLRARSNQELSAAMGTTQEARFTIPEMFGIASGRRGA